MKKMRCLLFLLSIPFIKALCPVSSTIFTQTNGFLNYPLNVYADSFDANNPDLYRCESYERHYDDEDLGTPIENLGLKYDCNRHFTKYCELNCSGTPVVCPVASENVKSFVSTPQSDRNWKQICSILSGLDRKVPMNVLLLGTSVTAGSGTNGCCCQYDSKCQSFNASCFLLDNLPYSASPTCSWGYRFTGWLKSIFTKNEIRIWPFSNGGFSSGLLADNFPQMFEDYKKQGLRIAESDLVFLDHSHVDGQHKDASKVQVGMERLVRSVLSVSEGSGPVIIVLETWPLYPDISLWELDKAHVRLRGVDDYRGQDFPNDYGKQYRSVSDHYSLVLWSFRDVAWSEYAREHQQRFLKYFKLFPNIDAHPPWHVHLFWADLLANAFLGYFFQCRNLFGQEGFPAPTLSTDPRFKSVMGLREVDGVGRPVLPPLLMEVNSSATCKSESPLYLDVRAESLFKSGQKGSVVRSQEAFNSSSYLSALSPLFESGSSFVMTSSPDSTSRWALMEDRHKKFGWVATAVPEAGSMIPGSTFPGNSTLTFHLSGLEKYFDGSRGKNFKLTVRGHYLRTYLNAGTVLVYFCGQQIGVLDALWPHYPTMHASLPEPYQLSATLNLDGKPPPTPEQCEYLHFVHRSAFDPQNPPLRPFETRVHQMVGDPQMKHQELEARGYEEKFKLISVLVCESN